MNMELLETFLAVSDSRSFRRAADRLHISQSAVTVRIKQLEETIGKPLFLRHTRHVELTPSGAAFLPYAARMSELMQEGIAASRLQGLYAHHLAIGATNSILEYYLFSYLETFRRHHPDTAISLVTSTQQDLFQRVLGGSLDMAVLFDNYLHPELVTLPLESSPLILAGSRRPDAGTVTNQTLLQYNYVHLDWGVRFTAWYERQFGKDALPQVTASHTSLLLKFILEGDAIGFIPEKIAESFFQSARLQRLPADFREPPPGLGFHLLYAPKKLSGIAKTWIDFLTSREP